MNSAKIALVEFSMKISAVGGIFTFGSATILLFAKDGKFSNAEVDQLSHINEHKLGVIRDLALAINIPHIW